VQRDVEVIDPRNPVRIQLQGLAQEARLRRRPEGRVSNPDIVRQWAVRSDEPPNLMVFAAQSQLAEQIVKAVCAWGH